MSGRKRLTIIPLRPPPPPISRVRLSRLSRTPNSRSFVRSFVCWLVRWLARSFPAPLIFFRVQLRELHYGIIARLVILAAGSFSVHRLFSSTKNTIDSFLSPSRNGRKEGRRRSKERSVRERNIEFY